MSKSTPLANVNPADLVVVKKPSYMSDDEEKKPPFREVDNYFYNPADKKFQNIEGKVQEPFTFENVFVTNTISGAVISGNPFQYATVETLALVVAFCLKIPNIAGVMKHTKQLEVFAVDSHPQYFVELIFLSGKTLFSNAGTIASQIMRAGETAVQLGLSESAFVPQKKEED